MKLRLTAIALAVLLVGAGIAGAAGAVADHADAANEHRPDRANDRVPADAGPPEDAGDAGDVAGNASDAPNDAPEHGSDAPESADEAGPPADLPAAVPDHVGEIHDLIRSFVAGDLNGSLGDHVSDVTRSSANDSDVPAPVESANASVPETDAASEGASNAEQPAGAAQRGPPIDLPDAVPSHVGAIRDAIGSFLDGGMDSLGDRVSAIAGGT